MFLGRHVDPESYRCRVCTVIPQSLCDRCGRIAPVWNCNCGNMCGQCLDVVFSNWRKPCSRCPDCGLTAKTMDPFAHYDEDPPFPHALARLMDTYLAGVHIYLDSLDDDARSSCLRAMWKGFFLSE